jgi:DNA-binding NarL/FixJ family response regulator
LGHSNRATARPLTSPRANSGVLTLIAKGCSNAEIADELCISGVTVKSHIGHIFVKLDLRDRAAAIVYAYDNGIVAPR